MEATIGPEEETEVEENGSGQGTPSSELHVRAVSPTCLLPSEHTYNENKCIPD